LLVNQSEVRKGSEISQSLNALTFFRNYIGCDLFKIFLYPYFKKETLLAIGSTLLWDLFNYLSTCCHSIERKLKYSKHADIPVTERIFSWNKIPGEDNDALLSHLKQIFNLESVNRSDIKKKTPLLP
jgi:hypothetical protein